MHKCILRKQGKFKITKTRIKPTALPSHADIYADLHMFDPAAMAWTDLTLDVSGAPPSPRGFHGFTAAGARLYVHGGFGEIGDVYVVVAGVEKEMGISTIEKSGFIASGTARMKQSYLAGHN